MDPASRTLLLVEDSEDDELLSVKGISSCGVPCELNVVRRGDEVLRLLLSPEVPEPDLIVLDFHLPGLNGVDILRQLRRHEKTKHVPIVILSSLGSDQEFRQCLEEGANSCVQKPMDSKAYVDQVSLLARYWLTVHRSPEPARS